MAVLTCAPAPAGGVKQASHLLKYDSTLGKFNADIKCGTAWALRMLQSCWVPCLTYCGSQGGGRQPRLGERQVHPHCQQQGPHQAAVEGDGAPLLLIYGVNKLQTEKWKALCKERCCRQLNLSIYSLHTSFASLGARCDAAWWLTAPVLLRRTWTSSLRALASL